MNMTSEDPKSNKVDGKLRHDVSIDNKTLSKKIYSDIKKINFTKKFVFMKKFLS